MPVTGPESKQKTKAKQRYIKAKRERRKKRKSVIAEAHRKNIITTKAVGLQDVPSERSTTTKKDELESDQAFMDTGFQERDEVSSPKHESSERPHKRRKIVQEHDESNPGSSNASKSIPPSLSPRAQRDEHIPPETIAPLAAFPTLPVPVTDSRRTLAVQGLDPALVDAEVVDITSTTALDSSEDSKSPRQPTLGLSIKTRKRLRELGIEELFAVQTAIIPFLLPASSSKRALYTPYENLRDVCVSAPTGSGKTLSYVLPILEILSTRVVTRLRALVVLPTRDLVTQVRETFEAVCRGQGMKIGTATGQHSFLHEQKQLVDDLTTPLQGGSSKVDVLICTPGRLVDHLKGTPNFSLQHLRFLVIDEADRLLSQSFNEWLSLVLSATRPPPHSRSDFPYPSSLPEETPGSAQDLRVNQHDGISPAWLPSFSPCSRADEKRETSCQKLLFSATLTRDPAKISALDLRNPKYFVVKNISHEDQNDHAFKGEVFTFPATLTEHMVICASMEKPLVLFHLVHNHNVTNALVFTKSTESTVRLVKLFECFERARNAGPDAHKASAYSSDLSAAGRKAILDKFKAKEINILVCSDLISRGIDISHVSHVVSYDAPVDMRKYVHRVGRTARAGRIGHAWSLIEKQEARYFKAMLAEADHLAKVRKLKIAKGDMDTMKGHYETALETYRLENS